jgi:hypothetical protein
LDNIRHVLALPFQLQLLLSLLSFLHHLFLQQVLFAAPDNLLRLSYFPLLLFVEIFRHPFHLLHDEIPVSFGLWIFVGCVQQTVLFPLLFEDVLLFLLFFVFWILFFVVYLVEVFALYFYAYFLLQVFYLAY